VLHGVIGDFGGGAQIDIDKAETSSHGGRKVGCIIVSVVRSAFHRSRSGDQIDDVVRDGTAVEIDLAERGGTGQMGDPLRKESFEADFGKVFEAFELQSSEGIVSVAFSDGFQGCVSEQETVTEIDALQGISDLIQQTLHNLIIDVLHLSQNQTLQIVKSITRSKMHKMFLGKVKILKG